LHIFERKLYRRLLGPAYDSEKENWRILTNKEIYARVKKRTIIETVRLNRLKRPLGRPRRRWEDNVKIDLREMGGVGDWMELAQVRDRWRALVNTVTNFRIP